MKNLVKKTQLIGIILLMVLASSCSKEDGTEGPQGPQGTQGPQGDPGTANVMYSEWLDQDWNFTNSANFKTMLVNDTNITNSFLENGGIVLGFFRFQENVPYQLPYQNFASNNVRTCYPVHFTSEGNVRFSIQSTDGTALTDNEVNGSGSGINAQYKYVLIPGGIALKAARSSLKWEDLSYKEVCDQLGIDY